MTDNLTDSNIDKKVRAPRAKRKVKEVSELDESLIREFKKNRIGSKVIRSNDIIIEDNDKFTFITDKIKAIINESTKKDKKYLYILDKFYPDNNICFLTGPVDSFTIVINSIDVYKRLKEQQYDLTEYSKLYFYDDINGLTDHS